MKMNKFLFIANAVLTLPFGVAGLIAPVAVFAGFGIALDSGAQLIARGYAATSIGYGCIYFLLRDNSDSGVIKALLLASLLFNLIETVIQSMGGAMGIASPAVWGTVLAHAIMSLFSAWAFLKKQK
jgi:hypothetical protein